MSVQRYPTDPPQGTPPSRAQLRIIDADGIRVIEFVLTRLVDDRGPRSPARATCPSTPPSSEPGNPPPQRGIRTPAACRAANNPATVPLATMLQSRTFASLVTTLAIGASCACAEPTAAASLLAFRDDFTSLDTSRWTTGDRHQLGRSEIDPTNVEVRDGSLRLKMPPDGFGGAELKTVVAVPPGVFEARVRLANAPSSVTGLFLYAPPDYAHEVDIELYNQTTGRVRFTTYAGGAMTHTVESPLPFDPTADFHLYGIAYTPSGVEFYVDQRLVQAWDGGIPRNPMNLYINTWYPQWLAGLPSPTAQATTVDYATYRPSDSL